ncbi:hypothetical protein Droror1_Dr00013194 [Drosera rotundifolia]
MMGTVAPLAPLAQPLMVASLDLRSSMRLTAALAQYDTAAKGTLVTRLHDEVERVQSMFGCWIYLVGKDDIQVSDEMASQLIKKTDSSYREQLDELEEHLYLCFTTINRTRDFVAKEISGTRPASLSSTSP